MAEQSEAFVDRTDELSFLRRAYASGRPELLIIYGRRRIGKTELALRSIPGSGRVYFIAEQGPEAANLRRFREAVSEALGDPLIAKADIGWEEVFGRLGKRRLVVAIDEFPRLLGPGNGALSAFQRIWDRVLPNTRTKLVLLGSAVSVMETDVLGYKSPLYGRRTGQINLGPLGFVHLREFFPRLKPEELVRIYGITDGIPAYIREVQHRLGDGEPLESVFLPNRPLYEEAEFLLKTELREPGKYFQILKAIAAGSTKFGDIVNSSGLPGSTVSQYLDNLQTLRIVGQAQPFGEKEARRSARYRLADNYYGFYFRFIHEHQNQLQSTGRIPGFSEKYNQYLGGVFEKAALENVRLRMASGALDATDAGRWWHKGTEIDIVATGPERAYFIEAKWSTLGRRDADAILSGLAGKASLFPADIAKKRMRVLGIVAKRFGPGVKASLLERGVLAIELRDFWSAGRAPEGRAPKAGTVPGPE